MMPPHITATEPADGGTLDGDTIVLHGHTLSVLGKDEYGLTDGRGTPVAFELDVSSEVVGEGDLPGSVQERSRVALRMIDPPRRCRLRVLDVDIGFTVAP